MLKATIVRLQETTSTNHYATEMLANSRPAEGSVIIAGYQSRGKGADTNGWESEKGKNLTFSIIFYPQFTAEQQFIMNKAISLGIYNFLKAELPTAEVSIKWPNDLYIGGKKVCGILIQNSILGNRFDYVVAGIGLNVNQTLFVSDAPNPVSMKLFSGQDYDLNLLLDRLLKHIFEMYSYVNFSTKARIEKMYEDALYRFGTWHQYLVKGTQVTARITGTSPYGQLLLENTSGKVIICDLKEVKFLAFE